MTTMTQPAATPAEALGPITLRYLDLSAYKLAGRGGAVRFLFQALGVPFTEDLVAMSEWQASAKAKLIASKENVSGHLPIVQLGGRSLTEHHATMRYVSRLLGLYGKDPARDYETDKIADASVEWRNALLEALFGDDAKKASYREKGRPDFYGRFEHFLSANGSAPGYAVDAGGSGSGSGSGSVTLADALVFALLWDDRQGFGGAVEDFGGRYPRLAALWGRFGAIPAVKAWTDSR